MSANQNILIPDGDSTWALSVMQCLSQAEGYNIFVLSSTKRTATKFSSCTSYYKFYERTSDIEWIDIINSEIEKHAITVVLPIAEQEILFFIKNKEQISSLALISPLPNLKDFETAVDKRKLSDFAKIHNIPHPNSFYFTSGTDTQGILSQIKFPILIKPLHLKGGDGIQKINARDTFQKYLEKANDNLYVQ